MQVRHILTRKEKQLIVDCYKKEMPTARIAEIIGCTRATVSYYFDRYCAEHPEDAEAVSCNKQRKKLWTDAIQKRGHSIRVIPVKNEKANCVALSPLAPSPVRHCPNCGEAVMRKTAKFCWACGADVRDRHLILLEKVRKSVHSRVNLLPNNLRDEFNQVVLEVEDLLMKEAEG